MGEVTVTLSSAEALVLFDWLARSTDGPAPFADEAEQRVLWRVEGILEGTLVAVVDPDYASLLSEARRAVMCDE